MGSNIEIFEAMVLGGNLSFWLKYHRFWELSCLRVNLRDLYVGFKILVSLSHTLKNYFSNQKGTNDFLNLSLYSYNTCITFFLLCSIKSLCLYCMVVLYLVFDCSSDVKWHHSNHVELLIFLFFSKIIYRTLDPICIDHFIYIRMSCFL